MRKVGAVILAAGASQRLGRPKQLVEFQGKSLLRLAVDAAVGAGCHPVIVVVGSNQALRETGRILSGAEVEMVPNDDWERGVGTSVRAGLSRIVCSPEIEASLLLVCDQPFVSAEILGALIALQNKSSKAIVASAYAGTVGVPALFKRACFAELLELPDDQGAKRIIERDPDRVALLPFPAGAVDIDTPAEYEALGRGD